MQSMGDGMGAWPSTPSADDENRARRESGGDDGAVLEDDAEGVEALGRGAERRTDRMAEKSR